MTIGVALIWALTIFFVVMAICNSLESGWRIRHAHFKIDVTLPDEDENADEWEDDKEGEELSAEDLNATGYHE